MVLKLSGKRRYPLVKESFSEKDTENFGEELGKNAVPGTVICLNGDLGAGKTAFSRGFARGLEIPEPVTSPTFVIMQAYSGGRLPLYHFDLYRLEDPDELYDIGYDDQEQGGIRSLEGSIHRRDRIR